MRKNSRGLEKRRFVSLKSNLTNKNLLSKVKKYKKNGIEKNNNEIKTNFQKCAPKSSHEINIFVRKSIKKKIEKGKNFLKSSDKSHKKIFEDQNRKKNLLKSLKKRIDKHPLKNKIKPKFKNENRYYPNRKLSHLKKKESIYSKSNRDVLKNSSDNKKNQIKYQKYNINKFEDIYSENKKEIVRNTNETIKLNLKKNVIISSLYDRKIYNSKQKKSKDVRTVSKSKNNFKNSKSKYKNPLMCKEIIQNIKSKSKKSFIKKNSNKSQKRPINFIHEKFEMNFTSQTLNYLIEEEKKYSPHPHYISYYQKNIKWQMRAILIDWMKEVCSDYLFKRETFHYSINFIDRFLSKYHNISKKDFQLVGLTGLYLSAKMEEVYTPKVDNMITASNGSYSKKEILKMENFMYKILNFDITPPTLNLWANWYVSQWDNFIKEESVKKENPLLNSNFLIPLFKNPDEKSYALYRSIFQYIDCAVLDVKTLQYKQRAIVAAFLYIIIGKYFKQFTNEQIVNEFPRSSLYLLDESFAFNNLFKCFMKKCFGFNLPDLLPTIQFASTFFPLEINLDYPIAAKIDPENVLKGHFEDFLAYQTHNSHSLKFIIYERNRTVL